MSRKKVLENIVLFKDDLSELEQQLYGYGWDSEEELVILSKNHILEALDKYMDNTLSNKELEKWAEILESRDDVGYDREYENVIKDIIYELANSSLEGDITANKIQKLKSLF